MGEFLGLWVNDSNLLIAWLVVLRQGLTLEPCLALNSWKSSYLRLPNVEVTSHHIDLYLILIAWFYSTNLQLVPFDGAWSVDSPQLAPELLQVNTQKPEAFCSCSEMGEVTPHLFSQLPSWGGIHQHRWTDVSLRCTVSGA